MPSLTQRLINLQQYGPVIELQIIPTTLYSENTDNATNNPSNKVLAMIDTGAMSSVVQQGICEKLKLNPTGMVSMTTPSSEDVQCYQYDISLLFPSNVFLENITVTEAPLQGQHIQLLVGRDVLQHGVFIYNGYDNSFTLSF
jgi:hypothetical protein